MLGQELLKIWHFGKYSQTVHQQNYTDYTWHTMWQTVPHLIPIMDEINLKTFINVMDQTGGGVGGRGCCYNLRFPDCWLVRWGCNCVCFWEFLLWLCSVQPGHLSFRQRFEKKWPSPRWRALIRPRPSHPFTRECAPLNCSATTYRPAARLVLATQWRWDAILTLRSLRVEQEEDMIMNACRRVIQLWGR